MSTWRLDPNVAIDEGALDMAEPFRVAGYADSCLDEADDATERLERTPGSTSREWGFYRQGITHGVRERNILRAQKKQLMAAIRRIRLTANGSEGMGAARKLCDAIETADSRRER